MANKFVGIDIGSALTKAVVIERGKLSEAFSFPTPRKGEKDSGIDPVQFIARMQEHIPSAALKRCEIGVGLPNAALTTLAVFLPAMSKKESRFAALNEARQKMIPATGPQHIFESLSLRGDAKVREKSPRAEVLVMRANKDLVQDIVQAFSASEIYPRTITSASNSLAAALPKDSWKKDEATAFADIGATCFNISIAFEGQTVFIRTVMYGLKDIAMDFSRQLGIEPAKMEAILFEKGVPDVPYDMKNKVALAEEIMRQKYESGIDSSAPAEAQVNLLELRMLWEPHLERIVQELRRSFVFFKEQIEAKQAEKIQRKISTIYFLGGGGCLKGFVTALGKMIGVTCEPYLIFKGEQAAGLPPDAATSPFFTSAAVIAACVQPERLRKPAINFLPYELKRKEVLAVRRLTILICGLSLCALFCAFGAQLLFSNSSLRSKIKETSKKIKKVKVDGASFDELAKSEKTVLGKNALIDVLRAKNFDLLPAVYDISLAVPAQITLQEMMLTPLELQFKGSLSADYETAAAIVGSFKKKLEALPYLSKVIFSQLSLEEMNPGPGTEPVLTKPINREFSATAALVNAFSQSQGSVSAGKAAQDDSGGAPAPKKKKGKKGREDLL